MQTTTREMLYPNPTVSPHIVRNYDFLVNITSIIIRGDVKYYFADFVRKGGIPQCYECQKYWIHATCRRGQLQSSSQAMKTEAEVGTGLLLFSNTITGIFFRFGRMKREEKRGSSSEEEEERRRSRSKYRREGRSRSKDRREDRSRSKERKERKKKSKRKRSRSIS